MIFVSGVNIAQFITLLLAAGFAGMISIMSTPYRMKRFIGFKSPELNYQAQQSLIAIGSGKLIGKFYGNGLQKFSIFRKFIQIIYLQGMRKKWDL